jgi:hypothetical protein
MNLRFRRPSRAASLLVLAVLAGFASGCGTSAASGSPSSEPAPIPDPTCGGLKIAVENALPCGRVVELALDALSTNAPQQLARGVTAIDVTLAECPRNEVPPQITCGNTQFVQLVTVTFDTRAGGPVEPSLTVAVEPVSGVILGIENPLIR